MVIQKIREVSSHRLKEAIIYVFLKSPQKELNLMEISTLILGYFNLENEDIPQDELKTYRRRLHEALAEKAKTGFLSKRPAKNSIVKNFVIYKLERP
jgi:hypothetical protein